MQDGEDFLHIVLFKVEIVYTATVSKGYVYYFKHGFSFIILRLDDWLVALHVDVAIGRNFVANFGDSACACCVSVCGYYGFHAQILASL